MSSSAEETIARRFHEAYERLAPRHGYVTRRESSVPWEDVPAQNKELMVDVISSLLEQGVIDVGRARG